MTTARRATDRPLILVTGFGPFPGVPFNASETLVRGLGPSSRFRNPPYDLVTEILPTDWRDGPARSVHIIRSIRPDAIVHFGVASIATTFRFELRAFNVCRAAEDNSGRISGGFYVHSGGPPVLHSTFPGEHLAYTLRCAALPASLSRDAGRYLCNATLYHSLALASAMPQAQAPRAGFVHIPAFASEGEDARIGRMGWPELRKGAAMILHALAIDLRPRRYSYGRSAGNRIKPGSIARGRPRA